MERITGDGNEEVRTDERRKRTNMSNTQVEGEERFRSKGERKRRDEYKEEKQEMKGRGEDMEKKRQREEILRGKISYKELVRRMEESERRMNEGKEKETAEVTQGKGGERRQGEEKRRKR